MERIETLFITESNFDHKSILNKLDKPIDRTILDKIEAGVTLEDIEQLTAQGIPILKYKTQITIHGLFPELENSYIFGYKNLFQNKNLSIGVKYNAIDEEKRQRIAKRLNCLGFYYRRNSQGTEFEIMERITPENFEAVKTRLIDLKNKVDQSLYFGHTCLWVGASFGCKYLCFDLYINAIYESNIEPFLNKLGATTEILQERKTKELKEEEERKQQYEEERKQSEAKKQESINNKSKDIETLQTFPRVEKTNEPGTYILRSFDFNNELIFKVVYIYLPDGKKKPRWNRTEYLTINEALNHKTTENWSDSIYSGRLTGYKIK